MKYSKKMLLIHKKSLSSKNLTNSYWQYKFYVEASQNNFSYCYVLHQKKTQKIILEREPLRKLYLNDMNCYEEKKKERTSAKFRVKNNTLYILDYEFNQKFLFNEINEHIVWGFLYFDFLYIKYSILGDYPQNKQEIELLHRQGVTAVLNLQTMESMQKRGLNWEEMKEIYDRNGIYVRPCQIPDLSENILVAANALNDLIQTHAVIYFTTI